MSNFEFPHTRTYDDDLGWLINAVKNLKDTMETFVATESLKFADPITWNITTQYGKSTIVIDTSGNAYLSIQPVPAGVQLNDSDYWLEIFNFTAYTRTANRNLTVNVETNTTRATANYAEDDWLIWNDVLYNVIAPITLDDEFVIDTNIEHFTVEQFIKNWVTYATNLINQYKNDIDASELAYKNAIDASELAYRNQLAQDIADTTASLQAQLDAAIAGVTVDSEVINGRVEINNYTNDTIGNAIRDQAERAREHINDTDNAIDNTDGFYNNDYTWGKQLKNDGTLETSSPMCTTDFIPVTPGHFYEIKRDHDSSGYSVRRCIYDANQDFIDYVSYTSEAVREWFCPDGVAYVRYSFSINIYKAGLTFRDKTNRVDSLEDLSERNYMRLNEHDDIFNVSDYALKNITNAKRIDSDGTLETNSGDVVTDYIPTTENEIVSLLRTVSENYDIRAAYYDDNKDFVSYFTATIPERFSYQTPSGASYIRFSFLKTVYDAGISIIKAPSGRNLLEVVTGMEKSLKATNLFESGVFYSTKLKNTYTTETDTIWVTSDYIPVKPGQLYTMARLHDDTGFTVRRIVYDENKTALNYVTYSSDAVRDYMVPSGVYYIRYSVSYAVYIRGLTFRLKYNSIDEIANNIVDCYNREQYNYTGSKLDLDSDKSFRVYQIMKAASPNAPTGKTLQGFAISKNVLFQFMADNAVRLYDMKTGETINEFSCDCGHGNTATFSDTYYDLDDEFPLCYVTDSSEAVDGVHVYCLRISRTGATTIKTLFFAYSDFIYPIQFTISGDYAYLLCPHITSPAQYNKAHFFKCDMNNLIDNGDGTYTPTVLNSFELTVGVDVVTQGIKFLNGQLFLTSGAYVPDIKSEIIVIDMDDQSVKARITDFPEPIYSNELEDCDFILNPYTNHYDMVVHVRTEGYFRIVFNI